MWFNTVANFLRQRELTEDGTARQTVVVTPLRFPTEGHQYCTTPHGMVLILARGHRGEGQRLFAPSLMLLSLSVVASVPHSRYAFAPPMLQLLTTTAD
jgi:hypothetical protein